MSTRIARELLLQLDKKIHTAWDNVAEDPDVVRLESLFKQMLELSGQIAQELPESESYDDYSNRREREHLESDEYGSDDNSLLDETNPNYEF